MDAIVECFGRVDTKKWRCRGFDRILRSSRYEEMRCRGCDRILWSSRYEEIEVLRKREDILVE